MHINSVQSQVQGPSISTAQSQNTKYTDCHEKYQLTSQLNDVVILLCNILILTLSSLLEV